MDRVLAILLPLKVCDLSLFKKILIGILTVQAFVKMVLKCIVNVAYGPERVSVGTFSQDPAVINFEGDKLFNLLVST